MKNIIICSDGTWQSPESDTSTHILRIARGIPNRALGDHAGQWLAREAETCGLAFEPHFLDNLAPDHTALSTTNTKASTEPCAGASCGR